MSYHMYLQWSSGLRNKRLTVAGVVVHKHADLILGHAWKLFRNQGQDLVANGLEQGQVLCSQISQRSNVGPL